MTLPIFLYVPNLIGYARLVLLAYAVFQPLEPVAFVWTLLASFLLDLVDGPIARALSQTSRLGELLDVVADNTGRAVAWWYCARLRPGWAIPAALVVALEWTTFISTQLHARGKHWKEARATDPAWVSAYFASNFKNPIGIIGICGLFGLPIYLWAELALPKLPGLLGALRWGLLGALLAAGRLYSMAIELYFVRSYAASFDRRARPE